MFLLGNLPSKHLNHQSTLLMGFVHCFLFHIFSPSFLPGNALVSLESSWQLSMRNLKRILRGTRASGIARTWEELVESNEWHFSQSDGLNFRSHVKGIYLSGEILVYFTNPAHFSLVFNLLCRSTSSECKSTQVAGKSACQRQLKIEDQKYQERTPNPKLVINQSIFHGLLA